MKTISIIICSRNRADHLRQTLEALHRVLPDDDAHIEIVLVNSASTDHTPQVASDFAAIRSNVKYVFEPAHGQSIALNRGAREATGEIIVWLDDDVVPQSGWLENLTRPLIDGQYDVVAGRVLIAPHLLRDWMNRTHRAWLAEVVHTQPENDIYCLVGANMAATRDMVEKTRGYDPELGPGRLGYQGESLMVDQMVSLGARQGIAVDSDVVHHFEASRLRRKSWLKASEQRGRSSAYVSYHWYHTTFRFIELQKLRKRLQLAIWRLRNRPNLDPESEGISIDEMNYVQQIAFLDQYRIESRRPRLYEKQGIERKA